MSRRRSVSEERTDIDISPLIDMVFILLIFFMVTTTFVKDAQVELERPSAASASRASTKSVRVYLDQTGDTWVGETSVRPWMLQSHVRDALERSAQTEVLVVTDRRVAAEKLIDVVDQCRLAGATEVGVATRAEAG